MTKAKKPKAADPGDLELHLGGDLARLVREAAALRGHAPEAWAAEVLTERAKLELGEATAGRTGPTGELEDALLKTMQEQNRRRQEERERLAHRDTRPLPEIPFEEIARALGKCQPKRR